MHLAVVVGNPREASRTFTAAARLADALTDRLPATRTTTVDLATMARAMFHDDDQEVALAVEGVADADIIVVASPTYKASFTGLLKAFLDRCATGAWAGRVAIPIMTGGSLAHALAPDAQLRPVLLELGAIVATTSLYLVVDGQTEFDDAVETAVTQWLDVNDRALAMIGSLDREHRMELR